MTDNDKKLLTKRIAEFEAALEAAGEEKDKIIQEGCRIIAEGLIEIEYKVVENLREQITVLKEEQITAAIKCIKDLEIQIVEKEEAEKEIKRLKMLLPLKKRIYEAL